MSRGLGFRMESLVGFQSKDDIFLVKYNEILSAIREKISKGYLAFEVGRDDTVTAIEALTKDRFNTQIKLITEGALAAVVPFFANDSNILMKEFFRQTKWLESDAEVFQKVGQYKGSIDLETGKVFGDYAKGRSTLYLNYNMLMQSPLRGGIGLSNREIMAVHLHEQGHIVYPMAFATHLDHTNVIFEEAQREAMGKNVDARALMTRTFEKLNKEARPDLIDGLCSENPMVFTKAMLKAVGEEVLQHQSNGKYSNTNFEMLADNFATRFGLGKELVTALEKMTPGGVRWGDVIRAFNETMQLAQNVWKMFTAITLIRKAMDNGGGAIAQAVIWLLRNGIMLTVFFYALIKMSGESSRNYTYDDLVVRYTRIRSQLINDIKSRKLTKGDATTVINAVDTIGELIKEGRNWRTPLDFLFNTLNPEDRRAKDSIGRQQALETLINNDLFLASLKLQRLAG